MSATPNAVGAAIGELRARTGWTWAEVADHLGTTPTYARKLATGAGKFGTTGAGKMLRSNVADFERTGAAQPPQQRAQAVRAAGGGSRPAAPRTAPAMDATYKTTRSVFKGAGGRDGWAVQVTAPREGQGTPAGDREDARNAITAAVRSAAQGHRRVAFRVTIADPSAPGGSRTVDLGERGGYDAKRALAGINGEARDPFAWLVTQDLDRYGRPLGDDGAELDEDDEGNGILAVEVIGLP